MTRKMLEYDKLTHSFKSVTVSAGHLLLAALKVILASLSFTIIGYGLVALCFNTRTERRLEAEINQLDSLYADLKLTEEQLGDVITGLQLKDSYIYEQMFHSEAPNVDPVGNLDYFFGSDSIPDYKLISYTTDKAGELEARVAKVDGYISDILNSLTDTLFSMPPMTLPLKDISYTQIGATTGEKIQPFTKTIMTHFGMDVIAPVGESIFAPADGVVTLVSRSFKGQGNLVEISHPGGYSTRYEHLSDIYVRKGMNVRRGRKIATVGMSGSSFAPHLHYEILRDTLFLNPVDYIFASVGPEEYSNMLFMAANTKQSMD